MKTLTEEVALVLEKGKATMAAVMGSSDLKLVPSGDPLVTIKATHLEGDKLVTGIVENVVDGEMEELAAFEYLKISREATKNFHKKGGVEKFVEQVRFRGAALIVYVILTQTLKSSLDNPNARLR